MLSADSPWLKAGPKTVTALQVQSVARGPAFGKPKCLHAVARLGR